MTFLHSLLGWLRATFAMGLVVLSTLAHGGTLFVLAFFKLLLPIERVRVVLTRALNAIAESWIGVNTALIHGFTPTRIEVEGIEGLRRDGWYLVLANHQSWVDIPILQAVLNRRVPLLKFFLKRELIWVPVLGLAWWALDFPFMRRTSRAQLARRPELAGRDLADTRKACRRFARTPVSVTNFVEGTRFTRAKHAAFRSPFRHLLPPKAGGVAVVLQAMGDLLHSTLDVTIAYPDGPPTVGDLFTGRVRCVRVHVCERPIPPALVGGDWGGDAALRGEFRAWLQMIWTEKDARLEAMVARPGEPPPPSAAA